MFVWHILWSKAHFMLFWPDFDQVGPLVSHRSFKTRFAALTSGDLQPGQYQQVVRKNRTPHVLFKAFPSAPIAAA